MNVTKSRQPGLNDGRTVIVQLQPSAPGAGSGTGVGAVQPAQCPSMALLFQIRSCMTWRIISALASVLAIVPPEAKRTKSYYERSRVFQDQIDAWTARERALTAAAATIKAEQAQADSEVLSLARIAADLRKIDAQRTFLLSAEEADAEAETRAATEHERVGTFGFYTYEVVDENPLLPAWAKDGKFGH